MNIKEARNYLVAKRIEANIPQSEIAMRMQCTQAFVSKFEKCDSVGWRSLESYAEALGIQLKIEAE